MARYIDTELIEKHIKREDHYTPDERWRPESEFAALIDSIPTANVVEVVRCKDCKYYSKNFFGTESVCQHWKTWYQTNGNDFCSYGKKVE